MADEVHLGFFYAEKVLEAVAGNKVFEKLELAVAYLLFVLAGKKYAAIGAGKALQQKFGRLCVRFAGTGAAVPYLDALLAEKMGDVGVVGDDWEISPRP
jgi:hypothetical protein